MVSGATIVVMLVVLQSSGTWIFMPKINANYPPGGSSDVFAGADGGE
jgi:hypothetical protein